MTAGRESDCVSMTIVYHQIDKEPIFKSRNSGLCISTGTGSTSWIFNINKLTHHAVESLMKIIFETTRFPLNWKVKIKNKRSDFLTVYLLSGHETGGIRNLNLQQLDSFRPRVASDVLHAERSNLGGNFSQPFRAEAQREGPKDQCEV